MTLRQKSLSKHITLDIDPKLGLSRADYTTIAHWKKERVYCPRCLYHGVLYDFIKYNRKGTNKVSRIGSCPYCGNNIKILTLRKVAKYSMWEFANYFWESFYVFQGWKFKLIPIVKERLMHYPYSARQIFWEVWKEWKAEKENNPNFSYLNKELFNWRDEDKKKSADLGETARRIDDYAQKMKEAFKTE